MNSLLPHQWVAPPPSNSSNPSYKPPKNAFPNLKHVQTFFPTNSYVAQVSDFSFQLSRSLSIDLPNLLACGPGLTTFTSPHCEHGSIHQLFRPLHHAPGVTRFGSRFRMFLSIMSSTAASFSNCLAKAAPLLTISS